MKESELRTRAKEFAVNVLRVCDNVDSRKGRSVLINQITRSATSIGANIHEANYAASKADFCNKLQIALKECFETEYWIDLMLSAGCFDEKSANALMNECGIIRRMLISSITTAKKNSTERNQTNET